MHFASAIRARFEGIAVGALLRCGGRRCYKKQGSQFVLTGSRIALQCGKFLCIPHGPIMNQIPAFLCGLSSASKLQRRRATCTASGGTIAKSLAILLLSALVAPLAAQEARWNGLIKQATALRDQGRYAEGIPVAEEAVQVAEATFGANHQNLALSLLWLGLMYDEQGRYANAEQVYKSSLAIYEKALGPDHPDVAMCLNNLAELYRKQGRYAEAEPLYKRSLAIREMILGPDKSDLATSLNNLALLYQGQGKYAEAEPVYKRSLAIFERTLGPDHPGVATSLNNLALFYQDQDKYAEAEPLYRRSLAIYEKALGPEHPDVANSLNNLASIYFLQGKFAEAEPLYKRSLTIWEKALGPDHPNVAASLNNLAELYYDQGKYSEAEPLFNRSLAIRERALGPDHPNVAASLNNLALLYTDQGKYAEAEPLFKHSLATWEKILGPDHPNVAASLNNLAEVYYYQAKYAEAEPLFNRSLAIREMALGPDHPDVAKTLNNLASLYDAQGRYAEAEAFLERGLQNLSKQFENRFTYMSEKDRLQFLDTVQFHFDLYLSFCLAHRQVSGIMSKMYDLLLWEKGMVVTSVSALRAQVAASGDAEALKTFDQLTEKKGEWARLASTRPIGWEQLRGTADEEANDLEQQLTRRVNSLKEQKSAAHASWSDVQKKLQPGEAAVEFVRFRFNDGRQWTNTFDYVALVVTRQSRVEPTLVYLGDAKDLEADPAARLSFACRTSGQWLRQRRYRSWSKRKILAPRRR